ncbi:MAG: hypothetical protein P1V97_23510 [Planctomycetota bacterium]|nr:hypothetical protein [Planctomycetota bacterium]
MAAKHATAKARAKRLNEKPLGRPINEVFPPEFKRLDDAWNPWKYRQGREPQAAELPHNPNDPTDPPEWFRQEYARKPKDINETKPKQRKETMEATKMTRANVLREDLDLSHVTERKGSFFLTDCKACGERMKLPRLSDNWTQENVERCRPCISKTEEQDQSNEILVEASEVKSIEPTGRSVSNFGNWVEKPWFPAKTEQGWPAEETMEAISANTRQYKSHKRKLKPAKAKEVSKSVAPEKPKAADPKAIDRLCKLYDLKCMIIWAMNDSNADFEPIEKVIGELISDARTESKEA